MFEKIKPGHFNKVPTKVLLAYRVCILLYLLLIVLKTELQLNLKRDFVIVCLGIYQMLAACMFHQVMKIPVARLLMCIADLLTAQTAVLLTGGSMSLFIPCVFIPIFTLHIIYGIKGLVGGLMGLIAGSSAYVIFINNSQLSFEEALNGGSSMAAAAISLLILYIIPYLALNHYIRTTNQLKNLENRYEELDNMNSKLLVLYEMTGRFNFENTVAQVMDRLLALCGELFQAERICVFLIRGGEVEIYGKSTPQEKEDIYRLIMEQKKNDKDEGREYILREDALVIPLIRGTRTDGVLYFHGWKQKEITNRDAILFSMMANMLCTYLENLEYVESLQQRLLPETSILLSHLDSGKSVKGILDKRIVGQDERE
ncbi:MAG TPA: hypothetical protein GX505_11615 [Clostridiales bacterium]|nr:hypothetical protein [Clostridiales bacterium]